MYAPPEGDAEINTWNALIDAGEPYVDATAGPIADAVIDYRPGYYWLMPT